ncbi:hypothetical protein D9613_000816 [Agrocybe pediades]|uniref:Uncharacterized protein n=1 Tax=Agrocybe pediades TaxID=84607 RepID=A0A8H4VSC5_9AGAR|nr:hypothetical protein D9613_000816 [Agrocybe pediades]
MSNSSQQSTRYAASSSRTVGAISNWITFQHGKSCVFVKPAESHREAITIAQKEFDELANVTQDRIAFTVEEKQQEKNAERRHVRISESAWPAVITKLSQGAIINVVVRPNPDSEKPPQYLEVPSLDKPVRYRHSGSPMKRVASNNSTRSSKSANGMFSWIGAGK